MNNRNNYRGGKYNNRGKNFYPKRKNKVKEMTEKRQHVCDAAKERTGPT